MKHPLEFDGKCSNPKHWMLTGMSRKQRISYWGIAIAMWVGGWIVGGILWVMAWIDKRKHGLAHHQTTKGKWL